MIMSQSMYDSGTNAYQQLQPNCLKLRTHDTRPESDKKACLYMIMATILHAAVHVVQYNC